MAQNVGIIYDGTKGNNWDIGYFKQLFEEKGISAALFDANWLGPFYGNFTLSCETPLPKQIRDMTSAGYSIWMNRVYPSEAERSTINKSLNLTAGLSEAGFVTINPLTACMADYDKFFSYESLVRAGVPTPDTMKIRPTTTLEQITDNFCFPLIVKRNTGGRGIGVMRVENEKGLASILDEEVLASGRYLVQKFVSASRDHDIRVGVVGGEPLISYGRTLVKKNGEDPWMGSCHYGSKIIPYQASEEECDVAVRASEAIGANLNEVDIQITQEGPIVIENNPTPGYDKGEEHWVKLIVDHISNIQ